MSVIAQARVASKVETMVAGKSGKTSRDDGANPAPVGDWLRRALSVRKGIGKEIASALEIETSAVSRLKSNKRRVQLTEVRVIERVSGVRAPLSIVSTNDQEQRPTFQNGGGSLGGEQAVTLVRVLVVIAPSVWRAVGVTVAVTDRVPYVPDVKLQGMQQYACKIESEENKYAICVPHEGIRVRPTAGDIVHVRRTDRDGNHEDTLRAVRILPGGRVQLRLEGGKPKDPDFVLDYPNKDDGSPNIQIRGLVVGFYSPRNF